MPENIINWTNWLTINHGEVEAHLQLEVEDEVEDNLHYRFYTLTLNGASINEDSLINYLKEQVTKFIYSDNDIREFEQDGLNPFDEAIAKFGDIDPIRDGKYGELLLYVLTEAILSTPMVVQKLSFTYPNNQVMGADGVFLGEYKGNRALLIGESKMQQNYSICLSSAISSLERFNLGGSFLKEELWMARKYFRDDLNVDNLDIIYDCLKQGTDAFNANIIVHPTLLIYKEKEIQNINDRSSSKEELEKAISDLIELRKEARIGSIKRVANELLERERVYLDFFLIPVANVNEFREKCYEAFHGHRYERED